MWSKAHAMQLRSSEESVQPSGRVDQNPYKMSVAEVYDFYDELRSCPVQHSNALGGFYWLTRYDDVRAAAQDWENFSSARKGVLLPPDPSAPRMPAIEQDPPGHAAWRKLYMEPLTPEKLRAVEPRLQAIANEVIDEFSSTGECDLMNAFAAPLPVLGMCEVVGISGAPVARIRDLSYQMTRSVTDPERRAALNLEIGALVLDEVLARRAQPRDDYLTRVAHAEIDGRQMDEPELMRFMIGFLVAGHETTTSALGTLLFHALSRPDLKQRMLSDENVLSTAIEETVRWGTPFHAFNRTTTAAVRIDEVTIPDDATVRLCFAAANRDPAVYEHPDVFDPDRTTTRHLGFGHGRHVCLGRAFGSARNANGVPGIGPPASRHPFARDRSRMGFRRRLARGAQHIARQVHPRVVRLDAVHDRDTRDGWLHTLLTQCGRTGVQGDVSKQGAGLRR
jgi:cytochrome P450